MQKKPVRKLFVGLGNPGEEYTNTYHNVGSLMLVYILSHYLFGKVISLPVKKPQTLNNPTKEVQEITWVKHKDLFEYIETEDSIFVRPMTYMNESGKAIREAMKKFGVKAEDLVVIHDDSDIVIGNYKISFARSSAGHKGVQSVIDALKTNAFTRIRIGIRPAREKQRQKAGDFALKQISKTDRAALADVFKKIAEDQR
jgi:PTH1 family peptidyl-tRNA hydrolase